ncbi:MAG TPA: response regulator [Bryobacteraceae bacterium]|nr:response regulator [Bryobacteraceae bacterium]
MSIRILFVDDEPLLLEGLKRSLRPMRRQWDTAFATGGEEALALLAREAFDVIVTDMRMPGMDGAALLNEVTARYPGVLRMVLSGQSDLESLVKSAGVTHQYLTKPCAMEHLKDAVNRAVSLRDLLGSQPLKQLVSRMGSVPSAPPVYVELMDCLKSKDASIERAARIIQKDMGMTAKVLQLANSPFFGAAGRMISAADAVQCLGLENIRALLLTVHAFSEFRLSGAGSFSMQALWRHSLATAAMAERIMQTLPSADTAERDQIGVAGLLHDVGRVLLAANLPDAYERAHALAAEKRMADWQAEQEVFSATHAVLGAYLIGLWGLPEPIVEAVAYHHTPSDCPHPGTAMLTALHVADSLEYLSHGGDAASSRYEPDLEYLAGLGLAGRLAGWRELCAQTAAAEARCG